VPRLSLVACLVLALAACSTRRNPDFCCSDPASCGASGTDVDVVPCLDPTRSFCDDNGAHGAPRTCIADPISSECEAPGDCTNPARPLCIGNRCVECADGAACDNPTPACNADTHLCGPCTGPDDCVGDPGGGECLVGACVECADASDCAELTAPVCEPSDHACRGCRLDGECATGVCDRTRGSCAATDEVLYVAAGGTGLNCTRAAPCGTINGALTLAGGSRIIAIGPGTFTETLIVTGNRTVRLHGAGAGAVGATTITAGVTNTSVLVVSGGATLTIENLVVSGASGASASGVRCTDASVTVRRSRITANSGGGVSVARCNVELVNDIIDLNGGPTSSFGGVLLNDLLVGVTATFAFNTVINNAAFTATIAGVTCSQVNLTIPLESSIVYGNGAITDREIADDGNSCVAMHSVVGDVTPGPTNINTNPGPFTNGHLGAGSPVEGTADAAATLDHDLDGDLRPAGTGRDPGADELP